MSQISQLLKLANAVSIIVTVTILLPSQPKFPPFPQQPNQVLCHIILWLVDVVPLSTNRKGGGFFLLLVNTSFRRTLSWEKPIFIVSSCTECDGNIHVKSVVYIIYCIHLGLSTQFKNWYIVWRLHQHKTWNRDSLRQRLGATSS